MPSYHTPGGHMTTHALCVYLEEGVLQEEGHQVVDREAVHPYCQGVDLRGVM